MDTRVNIKRPDYMVTQRGETLCIQPVGDWTLNTIGAIDPALKEDLKSTGYDPQNLQNSNYDFVVFDFSDLVRLDTAGAYILTRAIGCQDGFCRQYKVEHAHKGQEDLLRVAAEASENMQRLPNPPWYAPLSRLGEGVVGGCNEVYNNLVFFGEFVVLSFQMLLQPKRIRWKSVVSLIETVGLDALPIVMILSFFIGCVIAFMGSDLLASFGAKVFVVDLVGIAVLREFGVLITGILLAARSNSSFTAQIGSMKMRQEIDAMTVIGLGTGETLVAPRVIACLVSAPILTFFAMLAGLFGGMLVGWSQGISPILYTSRLVDVVDINNFWVGMVKAPAFALVVALIGCRQGLAVSGSVESLGMRTTRSVVQAIFTIIVLDALFALLFLKMGV